MNMLSEAEKKYNSAKKRFIEPVINRFLEVEFPSQFGPIIREKLALELMNMIDETYPKRERIKPGQIVWNVVDKMTPYYSEKVKFKPVVLTVCEEGDLDDIIEKKSVVKIRSKVIARMCNEAYQQGGLLSMRDIGLLLSQDPKSISDVRIKYEKDNDIILPHLGSKQDCGTTLTHKKIIVEKIVKWKKDPKDVAKMTNHSQKSVDNYYNGYRKVIYAKEQGMDLQKTNLITGISVHVIKQYLEINNEIKT